MRPQGNRSARAQRARQKPRRTQQERRTETRRKLIHAAIRLLHESGFARFTIGAVASRAGLTSGAVQHHFQSSHDLLRGVVEALFPMLQIQVDDLDLRGESVSVRVGRIIDVYWEKLYGRPNYLVFWELTFGTRKHSGLQELLKAIQREFVAKAVSDLTNAFGDVGMRPSAAFRLWTFIGNHLRGLALLSLFEEQRVLKSDLKYLKEAAVQVVARPGRQRY